MDYHHHIDRLHHHYTHYKTHINHHIEPYISKLDLLDILIIWTLSLLVGVYIFRKLARLIKTFRQDGVIYTLKETAFRYAKKIPAVRRKIDNELSGLVKQLDEEIKSVRKDRITSIPQQGFSAAKITERISSWQKRDEIKRNSKQATGCSYIRDEEEIADLIQEQSKGYFYANSIHFEVYPSVC